MAKGDDPAAATGRSASPDSAAADALAKAERKAAKVAEEGGEA